MVLECRNGQERNFFKTIDGLFTFTQQLHILPIDCIRFILETKDFHNKIREMLLMEVSDFAFEGFKKLCRMDAQWTVKFSLIL